MKNDASEMSHQRTVWPIVRSRCFPEGSGKKFRHYKINIFVNHFTTLTQSQIM